MPCPHGNGAPTMCSQCLGAKPSTVELVRGKLVVNGVVLKTTAQHTAAAEEVMMRVPAARRGGLAPRVCSVCRQPGHNAKTCPRGR